MRRALSGAMLLACALAACSGPSGAIRDQQTAEQIGNVYEAYVRSQFARRHHNRTDALVHARRAVQFAPGEAELYLNLGDLLFAEGQYEEAAEVLEDGIDVSNDPIRLYLTLASVYEALAWHDDAEDAYTEAILADNDDVTPVLRYAEYATRLLTRGRADEIVDAFLSTHPDNARAWRFKGENSLELADYQGALDAYRNANAIEPDEQSDYVSMISISRELGDLDTGRSSARECFRRFRQRVSCRVAFIRSLEAAEIDGAEREAEVFGVLQTMGRAIGANLGRIRQVEAILSRELNDQRALMYMEAVAADRPRNTQIQARTAWAAYRTEDEDIACEYMRNVLEVRPHNADALNFIGYSYAERGIEMEEAEALVLAALEVRPNDANIQDSLGWVYYASGRYPEAVKWLDHAVSSRPDSAVLLDHLADALRAAGDVPRALEIYRQALFHVGNDVELADNIRTKISEIESEVSS